MVTLRLIHVFFFFFNDTATTEIYTLSLHDALPIYPSRPSMRYEWRKEEGPLILRGLFAAERSEEHTSELQSHLNLVCRLLLEKKQIQRDLQHQEPWRSIKRRAWMTQLLNV